MLSGKVPFPGNSELEIIGNVIKGDFHFNHEPFSRHSPDAKAFLQCLIRKDVGARFTAEQALNHDWIQKHSLHENTTMSAETFEHMKGTYDTIKMKKATLHYLSQECPPNNLMRLSELLKQHDPEQKGVLVKSVFMQCMQQANMNITQTIFDIICDDLLKQEGSEAATDVIPYRFFVD